MGNLRYTLPSKHVKLPKKSKMTEAAAAPKVVKAKKPAKKAEHPPSAVMVLAAVKALRDKKGSSLPAIKKYIAANYKVDVVKVSPFIRKAIKKLVEGKKIVKVKASFKAVKEEKPKVKKAKKPKAKKPKAKKTAKTKTLKKAKKTAAKKPKTAKKAAAKKPKTAKKAAKKPAAKKPAAKKSPKKAAKKAAPKKK